MSNARRIRRRRNKIKRLSKILLKCIIIIEIILIVITVGKKKMRPEVEPIHLPRKIEKVNAAEETEIEMDADSKETTEEVEETTEVVVIETKEPYLNYTQEDVYLVGNTTFHEVGVLFYKVSEEEATKAARMTAACLVNRAKMNYHFLGRTIQSQLTPTQYASVEKITSTHQEQVPDRFYEIAEDILQNGHEFSERLVFQSEFEQGENIDHIYNQYFGLVPESEFQTYKKAN